MEGTIRWPRVVSNTHDSGCLSLVAGQQISASTFGDSNRIRDAELVDKATEPVPAAPPRIR